MTLPTSVILVEGIPEIAGTSYAFIQRGTESRTNRILFYIVGLSEQSTVAAANYLASQWPNLYPKYGSSNPFLIMLRFDDYDFRKWTMIFER